MLLSMFFVVSFLAPEQQTVARTDKDEGPDDTGSIPPPKWPSHAHRPKEQGKDMSCCIQAIELQIQMTFSDMCLNFLKKIVRTRRIEYQECWSWNHERFICSHQDI
jgi:hypothetical protein